MQSEPHQSVVIIPVEVMGLEAGLVKLPLLKNMGNSRPLFSLFSSFKRVTVNVLFNTIATLLEQWSSGLWEWLNATFIPIKKRPIDVGYKTEITLFTTPEPTVIS